jgi:hypothetical protein
MARSGSNADAWDYTWLQTDDNLNDFIKGWAGLDGGHAPAGIALMTGEASGLLDAWASSPRLVYTERLQGSVTGFDGHARPVAS